MAQAAHYVGPELAVLAQAQRADLYLAHSHNALPAAHRAARDTGARLGFDAEDLLVESPEEPVALMDAIERRCLPACSQVSTMSAAAAKRLQETRQLLRLPVILHNVPSLRERQGLRPAGLAYHGEATRALLSGQDHRHAFARGSGRDRDAVYSARGLQTVISSRATAQALVKAWRARALQAFVAEHACVTYEETLQRVSRN